MFHRPLSRRAAFIAALLTVAACANDATAPAPHLLPAAATISRGADNRSDRAVERTGVVPGLGIASSQGQQPSIVACSSRKTIRSSGRFGPGGGILAFGNSRLIIPGGALRDTVTISATPRADGTSTVDFQPTGLHFYKPAGLILDAAGCSLKPGDVPSVVYLDDAGQIREQIAALYDPHWQAVAAPIEHFSAYAIAF
jgi:hypothetical protein